MKIARLLPLIVVAVALANARAEAAPPAVAKCRQTPTTRTWTASGTTFRHTVMKLAGRTGWERATTGKDGTTTLRGRNPLGSAYAGKEWQRDGRTYRESTEGDAHALKVTEPNGTVRTHLTWPGASRDITTWWGLGNRVLTHVRNRAPDGRLTSQWRDHDQERLSDP